jgi:hypothetical protein
MENINIGFIATRIAGMDSVSVETEKWSYVLEQKERHIGPVPGFLILHSTY